jgi:hypothetical protein
MSILVPTIIMTPGACAPGVPPAASSFADITAASVALEGVTSLPDDSVSYTVAATFTRGSNPFLNIFGAPPCSTAYTFPTLGPATAFQTLQAAIAAASHSATPSSATPAKGIARAAIAGITVGCLVAAAALLGLLARFLVRRHGRRLSAGGAARPVHVTNAAAAESEAKRKPTADPLDRPVGPGVGPVGGSGGSAATAQVVVGDVDRIPEARAH